MSVRVAISPLGLQSHSDEPKVQTKLMPIRRPRTNLEAWRGKLPEALWSQLTRLRGAHLNSMEVFPLFAAAVVGGQKSAYTMRSH